MNIGEASLPDRKCLETLDNFPRLPSGPPCMASSSIRIFAPIPNTVCEQIASLEILYLVFQKVLLELQSKPSVTFLLRPFLGLILFFKSGQVVGPKLCSASVRLAHDHSLSPIFPHLAHYVLPAHA